MKYSNLEPQRKKMYCEMERNVEEHIEIDMILQVLDVYAKHFQSSERYMHEM